jgi:excisionase family DNA binding protein
MNTDNGSPWLVVKEAAAYIRGGDKLVYREARANRLRHAVVGGRRELRFRKEWLDSWLEQFASGGKP